MYTADQICNMVDILADNIFVKLLYEFFVVENNQVILYL